jgi:hypothetical protein
VLVYRRVQARVSKRLGIHQEWKYTYDPSGGTGSGRKWPWSKPGAGSGGATPESHADE